MRTFVAIDPEPESRELLYSELHDIRSAFPDIRWTARQNLHLTLRFLGQTDDSQVREMSRFIKELTLFGRSIPLRISGITGFPGGSRPAVVALRVENHSLTDLAKKIEKKAELLGFEAEKRPFRPHITIARNKKKRNLKLPKFNPVSISGRLTYLQSNLTPDGPVYTKILNGRSDRI